MADGAGTGRHHSRLELTAELRDYWRVLAAYEPPRILDLVGELTGRVTAAARLRRARPAGTRGR